MRDLKKVIMEIQQNKGEQGKHTLDQPEVSDWDGGSHDEEL